MLFKRLWVLFIFQFFIPFNFAQTKISGKIIDAENALPLSSVSIIEKYSNTTYYSDEAGFFEINFPFEKGVLILSKDLYTTVKVDFNGSKDFGVIQMGLVSIQLAAIELSIKDEQIKKPNFYAQHLPIQKFKKNTLQGDFISGLKNIPSLYISTQGGGMGDGKIILRGFSPAETQIFINDIQINDMETGWVYWSNWSGLSDIAKRINLFAGLYHENRSSPSMGGSIDIQTYKQEKKGFTDVKTTIGSGFLIKNSLQHHVVDEKNNIFYTFSIGKTVSDGSIQGTPTRSNTYYFDLQKKFEKHVLKAFIYGAPQWHGQRSAYEYHMATLGDYLKYGTNYNYNFGIYNGKAFNWTENYFHKNLMQLKWAFQPNSHTALDAFVYASFAAGGGTYEAGNTNDGIFPADRRWRNNTNGNVMWDAIDSYNNGQTTLLSDGNYYQRNDQNQLLQYINTPFSGGLTKIAFTNKHHWLGTKINFDKTINQHMKTHLEYHYRYTLADNFDRLAHLLGADGFMVFYDQNNFGKIYTQTSSTNINTAWNLVKNVDLFDKLHFHYQSKIALHALSGKTVYNIKNWNIFAQYNFNLQQNQRKDFFNYLSIDPNQNSKKVTQAGWLGLTGVQYANNDHTIGLTGGWMKKPNRFEQIFINYKNEVNEHIKPETVFSAELNYLFKHAKGFVALNAYNTLWHNKYTAIAYQNPETQQTGTAYLEGVNQKHLGVETVVNQVWNEKWQTNFSFSVGNWEYNGNAKGTAFDFSQNNIGTVDLQLNKLKVGNAAQLKTDISLTYRPKFQWEFVLQENYYDQLYSNLNINQNNHKAISLPSYFTTDFFIKTNHIKMGKSHIYFEMLIENLLNATYIIEMATNLPVDTSSENWNGINTANKVFFGRQRNFNLGMRVQF